MLTIFNKKDFQNSFWFVAEKVVQLCVGIFIVPKIYNELGADAIGKLEFSKTLIGYVVPILFLGLSVIAIREIITQPAKKHEILASSLFLRILSCLLLLVGLISYIQFIDRTDIALIVLILGFGYFIRVTDVLEYYILAKKNARLIFVSKITSLCIVVALQYYGVKQHFDVFYFAIVFGVDFLIQGLIYAIVLFGSRELQFSKFRMNWGTSIFLLKEAYPLILSNLVIAFYIGIDEFFLKYYLGDAAVGIFGSVQFLVIWLTWNIGYSFIHALFPAYVEAFVSDKILYKKRIGLSYKLVIAFGVFVGLFYMFTGPYIYSVFYDEEFHSAILPIQIFGWSPLFVFIGVIYEKHLVNVNELQKNVYRFIIGCISSLVLCYLLIPKYGVTGAAVAVLISHIITNLGFILLDKPSRTFFVTALKTK